MASASLTALITGGAGGLARAMINALRQDDVTCVAADRDTASLERLKVDMGGGIHTFQSDVADTVSCAAAVQAAVDATGRLDILINNAGIGMGSLRADGETRLPDLDELTDKVWDNFFHVNVRGPLAMSRAAMPHLKQSPRGQIVMVTTSYFTMHRVAP